MSLQVIPTWTSDIYVRTKSVLQIFAQRYQIVVGELHVDDEESDFFTWLSFLSGDTTQRHRQRNRKATPHIIACKLAFRCDKSHEFQLTFLIGCRLAPVALSRIGGNAIIAVFRVSRDVCVFLLGSNSRKKGAVLLCAAIQSDNVS